MPVAVTNVIKRRKRNSRMAGKIKRGVGKGGGERRQWVGGGEGGRIGQFYTKR